MKLFPHSQHGLDGTELVQDNIEDPPIAKSSDRPVGQDAPKQDPTKGLTKPPLAPKTKAGKAFSPGAIRMQHGICDNLDEDHKAIEGDSDECAVEKQPLVLTEKVLKFHNLIHQRGDSSAKKGSNRAKRQKSPNILFKPLD